MLRAALSSTVNAAYEEGAAAFEAVSETTKYAVDDAAEEVHNDAVLEVEAVIAEAAAAADEILAEEALAAAAEAVRVSRGEGLGAAVAAEALLNRFEMGDLRASRSFLVDSVAVETLPPSDAWAALQQSLTEACQ